MKFFISALLITNITGCAYRMQVPPPSGFLEKASIPYSRNFIVATPTFIANAACTLPALIIFSPLAYLDHTSKLKTFPNSTKALVYSCGAVVGAPFVPLSYVCPENHWYIASGNPHGNLKCAAPNNSFKADSKPLRGSERP